MRLTLLLLLGAGACTRPDAGQKGADAAAAVVEMQAPVLPLAEVARAIRRAVDSVEASHERLTVRDRETVAHVYGESGYLPVWLTANGGLRGVAEDALALLRQSADEGLRPADYDVAVLDSVSGRIASGGPPVVDDIARFEAVLTLAVSRYLGDLHDGRVDPRRVGFHLQANMDPHQIVFLLSSALSEGSLTVVARDLAPRLPQYGGLRAVLPKYRELAAAPEETIPELAALAPGDSSLGVAAIRRRLIRLGDLAPGEERDSSRYDSVLVAGVRSFQDRHGLEADGVIGRETLAELRVPLSWRVRQIEFALERLRWIPDLGAGPLVLVNIPMFELSAWDSVTPTATPSFRTGVIVGKALDTETPVLLEEMRYLIFRPYWNVPRSILRDEVLPAIRRDPGYLREQDMEIVQGEGDRPAILAQTPQNLALLAAGRLRVRQRPGPSNALGLVKFIFPNDVNVYLHGTPAVQLFDTARRDFSHGCVRVEEPARLAEFVLRDQPEWTPTRIAAAMHAAVSRRVDLRQPLPVLLFYSTATARPDGTVRFARDIYGHDGRLDVALQGRGDR